MWAFFNMRPTLCIKKSTNFGFTGTWLWIRCGHLTLEPWESDFISFKVHVVDREFIHCTAYELSQISACPITPQNVSFSSLIQPHWQPPIFECCYMHELFILPLHAWLTVPQMDGMWAEWELSVEFRELGEWFRWRNPLNLFLLHACPW